MLAFGDRHHYIKKNQILHALKMNPNRNQSSLSTTEKGKMKRWEEVLSRLMLFFEDMIKVPLFRCQRCGECILSHTAFICCQRCPKRIRNGPCGGTGVEGTCEVYPERKCVWYRIYHRSRLLDRTILLWRIEKIHNWNLEKHSAWLNVFTGRIDPPVILLPKRKKNELAGEDRIQTIRRDC